MRRVRAIGLALISLLLLSGAGIKSCENGLNFNNGTLTLAIADAPVDDVNQVTIQFSGVDITDADGGVRTFNFDPAQQINLLTLQNGQSQKLLDSISLPNGQYQSITLKLDAARGQTDSFIQFNDGSTFSLRLDDQSDGTFSISKSFTVQQGENTNLTIEIHLRKSILQPVGDLPDYVLKPSLRVVENSTAGQITGTVSPDLVASNGCVPAIYAYTGGDVKPTDLNPETGGIQPVSSTDVTLDSQSGAYTYTIAFLQSGQYSVAFTCDAGSDNPATVDTLNFVNAKNASLQQSQTATVNFP